MSATPSEPSGHYFSPRPAVGSEPGELDLVLGEGHVLKLKTDRGVFSADRVDDGTRLLLSEGPPVARHGTLVDLGCGYGPIAMALAHRSPDATIWAVDVNERARELCRANAVANGVAERVEVIGPDQIPEDLVVDQLWSNPPIRIGKAALHELLSGWLTRLRPGSGTAELVVHKHLGSDSLAAWLDRTGFPTERTLSRGGYRLLRVRSGAGPSPS